MIGVGFLEGNLDVSKKLTVKVHLIEPVLEGTMQLFFQFVILYIVYGPGTTNVQSRQISDVRYLIICLYWGRPLDLSSLLSSSNDSFPYFYFVLLTSTMISVGITFARILTKGKNPVIKNIISFKFLKVIIMLILKLLVQSYILMMALKSIMFKFVSKGRKGHTKHIYTLNLHTHSSF